MLQRVFAVLGLVTGLCLGLVLSHIRPADAARNASGTYSLPTGNPVVSGAAISSTVHNNTMSDFSSEITDSLSRSGKGPMLAPLELANGSVGTPALSFDSDTDCGLYRIGANNVGMSLGGAKVVDYATTGVAVTGTLSSTGILTAGGVSKLADGAVGAPGLTFTSDTDCGLYRIGANNVGLALNGAKVVDYATTGVTVTGAMSASGNLSLTGSAPASTTGFSNTLTSGNIVKAHGFVTGGSLGAQTVNGGFNIASASLVDAATDGIVITFGTAMANANYDVVILTDADHHVIATEKAAGSFKIALKLFASPFTVQAYTQFSSANFDFVVLGAQ